MNDFAADPPLDAQAAADDDTSLGGYLRVHERPPVFEGSDGHPYSVSIEAEHTADLRAPWEGYLVFLRWAENGLGIIGHVETPTLWRGRSQPDVVAAAESLLLFEVQEHLEARLTGARADIDPHR